MQMIEKAISPIMFEAFKEAEAQPKNRHERRVDDREKRLAERERVLAVLAGGNRE